jgi:uncharacterized phosphosugar-binding protein
MGCAADFLQAIEANLDTVVDREWGNLTRAADFIADAIAAGHRAYQSPEGHLMPAEAAPGRPGRPDVLLPLPAEGVEALEPGDVFVLTHQYGVLEGYVEAVIRAKARGAAVVALSPRSDPAHILRTHPSGTCVADHADIVVDTHIREGDIAVDAPTGGPGSCPPSAIVQSALWWTLVVGVSERLAQRGLGWGEPA